MAQLREQIEAGQRAQQIADGATQIWNDPELSSEAKALWKRKFPEGKIPEYDVEQRLTKRIDKMEADRQEAEKKIKDDTDRDRETQQRQAVRDKYGFNDEAMEELEKLRRDKLVVDYEVAASYLASQRPAPSDGADYDRHFWAHDRQPQYKEIAEDPEGYARKEILGTLRGMEQRNRS